MLEGSHTFKVGHAKVRLVKSFWCDHEELHETTSAGERQDDERMMNDSVEKENRSRASTS